MQNADEGEIAIALGVIEPVADEEFIADLKGDVVRLDLDNPLLALGEKDADGEVRRHLRPLPSSSLKHSAASSSTPTRGGEPFFSQLELGIRIASGITIPSSR
jgi:hypothetical protein